MSTAMLQSGHDPLRYFFFCFSFLAHCGQRMFTFEISWRIMGYWQPAPQRMRSTYLQSLPPTLHSSR